MSNTTCAYVQDLDGKPLLGIGISCNKGYTYNPANVLSRGISTASGEVVANSDWQAWLNVGQYLYMLPDTPIIGAAFLPADGYFRIQSPPLTKPMFVWQARIADQALRMVDTDWFLESARTVEAYYETTYASNGHLTYVRRYRQAAVEEWTQEGLAQITAQGIRAIYQSAGVSDIRPPPAGTYYESVCEQMAGYMYRVRRRSIVIGAWFYKGQAFGTSLFNPYENAGVTFGIDRII